MRALTRRLVVAGLAAVVLAPSVVAQEQGAAGDLTVQEIQREFDRLEIVEARRALGLDDQAFTAFGQRLQRIQMLRRRHQNQRRAILNDLRRAVDPAGGPIDEAAVGAKLAELGALGVRQAQELRRAQQALDALLTVRQRVQFRFFQERFERRKLDLLAKARLMDGGRGR